MHYLAFFYTQPIGVFDDLEKAISVCKEYLHGNGGNMYIKTYFLNKPAHESPPIVWQGGYAKSGIWELGVNNNV